jgi:hypothetical protein
MVADMCEVWNQARVIKLNAIQPGRLVSNSSRLRKGITRLAMKTAINNRLALLEIFKPKNVLWWNSGSNFANQRGCH